MITYARIILAAAIAVPVMVWAADAPTVAQIFAQLPAWPASVEATALVATQKTADELDAKLKAANAQLEQDMSHQAYASTPLDMGSDPAQAQARADALSKQMDSMTDAQKMAFARQMQAQMQQSMTMGALPNAAETQAIQTLASQQEVARKNTADMNEAQQKMTGLLSRYQDQQGNLDSELTVKIQALNSKAGKADCVADWKQRQQLDKHYADQHVALAGQMLTEMRPLYASEQKITGDNLRIATQAQQTAAVIHNPMLQRQSGSVLSGLRSGSLAEVNELVRAYTAAVEEAQRWQTQHQQVYSRKFLGCS